MTVTVSPGRISGTVTAPPSKSAAHRALICAALSGKPCSVAPIAGSNDMYATLDVLRGLGFTPEWKTPAAVAFTCANPSPAAACPCGESGSTLRILLPVAAALGIPATFTGTGRLPERPLEPLLSLMKAHGILFTADRLPFTLQGRLTPGQFALPGNISSQFVTGLLFALPLLEGDSDIILTSPLQSAGYVDLTCSMLQSAGICAEPLSNGYHVPGHQTYQPIPEPVESDWSNAAFWLCGGALFSENSLTIQGLKQDTCQGDRAVLDILQRMGAHIEVTPNGIEVFQSVLHGCVIDAAPIPDLIPILAVTAAYAQGVTEIQNAARLRIKESDRLESITKMLRALGGDVEEFYDRLIIHGGKPLSGGVVYGFNDHRIVMSAGIAALGCGGKVSITDAEAVKKSYPQFFTELQGLGGLTHGF